MALQHLSEMSVEAYFQLLEDNPEARYEYVDGYIYLMTGGTLGHSLIGSNMIAILKNVLRGSSCSVYNSDVCVQISEKCYLCPDVTVSCDPQDRRAKRQRLQSPCLIVEIISPGTEARDRGQKFMRYRTCSTVQEYLLINTDFPYIELFRREKNDLWTLYTFTLGEQVRLAGLGVEFPVTEIYEGIDFSEEEPD